MAFCCCFRVSTFGFPSTPSPKKLTGNLKNYKMTTNLKKNRLFQNRCHLSDQSLPAVAFPAPCPQKNTHVDEKQYDAQVEKVRNIMMRNLGMDSLEGLIMIDALHRQRIGHHFREDIKAALYAQYAKRCCPYEEDSHDLMEVALRFRLLRNGGYFIDANLFNKFKGRDGKFENELSKDTAGLLSLFEASQLRIRGEDVLDEAHEFSNQHLLHASMKSLNHNQESKLIDYTLKYPYHKCLSTSFFAPVFIQNSINVKRGWMKDVHDLAEMESNMVQMHIQNEVLQISKWWRDLGLSKGFEFARIEPLKWCMWPLAALPDPILSEQRVELTKSISFVYLIDDIFDVYGKLDELTIFTEAINRREDSLVEGLPDCMKQCFTALSSAINELSNRTYVKYGWNPTDSLWKAWAELCNAFLVEGRWFASGELPSTEAYLKNAITSTGLHVVLVHLFFLLGEEITDENVDFLNQNHLSTPVATILRLWDDLGSAKDENQHGHDGSIIVYYMNEHHSSSVEDARNYVSDMISDAWKQLTEEFLISPRFSITFNNACLNLARMVPLMYNYDDKHCFPSLKKHMKLLLCESINL